MRGRGREKMRGRGREKMRGRGRGKNKGTLLLEATLETRHHVNYSNMT
jgi:hypothetical protein